jgi:DNA gyrase subunit A
MGVQLINLGKRDAVVGIARNAEAGSEAEEVVGDEAVDETAEGVATTGTDEGDAPSVE